MSSGPRPPLAPRSPYTRHQAPYWGRGWLFHGVLLRKDVAAPHRWTGYALDAALLMLDAALLILSLLFAITLCYMAAWLIVVVVGGALQVSGGTLWQLFRHSFHSFNKLTYKCARMRRSQGELPIDRFKPASSRLSVDRCACFRCSVLSSGNIFALRDIS